MTDHDALLAAVLGHPDEDAPRLIYADWLQENGRPERADLIRVQVESERRPRCPGCQWNQDVVPIAEREEMRCQGWRGCDLRARSDALLAAHGGEWVPHVNALWAWRRGFVAAAVAAAADWVAAGDAVLAGHPVRRVRLTTWPETDRLKGQFRLAGRTKWTPVPLGEYVQPKLLAAEWPGVEFELPPADLWGAGAVPPGAGGGQ